MTLLHQAAQKAVAVPLVEQLRSIPSDAKLRIDTPNALGCMDTCSIPVGRLCHEAASALQQQPEPVAIWQSCFTRGGGAAWSDCSESNARAAEKHGYPCRVLYTAPPALQQQEVPSNWLPTAEKDDAGGVAIPTAYEVVYFRRRPDESEDWLRVPVGTAKQHVREELITRIVPANGVGGNDET